MTPCPQIVQPWWDWFPPVGIFIGILAGLGIIVPWFRATKAGRKEKAFWSLVMIALVLLELRSITLDSRKHQREQNQARCQQLESFHEIAGRLDAEIRNNQHDFRQTINQLNVNLRAENNTFQQTRPRASIEVGAFTDIGLNRAQPYAHFLLKVPYRNTGDLARNVHLFGHAYVGNPNQRLAAKEIVPEFEKQWAEHLRNAPPATALPKDIVTKYSNFSSGFSGQDIKEIQSGQKMIYELFRMRYTDQTGTWNVDRCNQVISIVINGTGEAIQCNFFNTGPKKPG